MNTETITEVEGVYTDLSETGSKQRYTAFTREGEEIDVDATNRRNARMIAKEALARDYEPGCKIIRLVGPRFGLYM